MPETSTVLHRQAHKAAPCSAEAEVDSPNNGKLGLYPDPRHDNRVRLIPLCGKAACQAFSGTRRTPDGGRHRWNKPVVVNELRMSSLARAYFLFFASAAFLAMASHDDRW